MGNQIIKQPDGLFAVFSTSTETITVYDATEDELVEMVAEEAAERARRSVRDTIAKVNSGDPRAAYFQFTMTWEEALKDDREHGGDAWKDFDADGLPVGERT
jgi:hypothetical protein